MIHHLSLSPHDGTQYRLVTTIIIILQSTVLQIDITQGHDKRKKNCIIYILIITNKTVGSLG